MIKLICFYLIFVGNRKIENETLFLRIITFNYGLILFFFKRTAMEKLLNENFIREITPLSDKDCFYIADRHKKEFTYPMHCHREFELNFVEHAPGVRRVVGDSAEVIGDYDLVLITSPDLEHVWEQNTCTSENIREITIQFVPSFMSGLVETNQFDMIRKMLDKAQYGLCFPMDAMMKVYSLIDKLPEMKGFYAVVHFLTLLYELSLFTDQARTLSSSSFAKIEVHSDSRRVQRVQDYIGKHYQEEIKLKQLADMVGMTEVSFSRFFKLRTGKNLSDYIIDLRLVYATRLLVDSTMPSAQMTAAILNEMRRDAMELSPLSKARMLSLRLSWNEVARMYYKYIGVLGTPCAAYRFEAVWHGRTVRTVVREPVQSVRLECTVHNPILTDGPTWDCAAVSLRAIDQNGSLLPYCGEAVQLSVDGPLKIIGPSVVPLRGGMAGTYLATTGEAGRAVLHCRMEGALDTDAVVTIRCREA